MRTALLATEAEIPGVLHLQLNDEDLDMERGFGRATFDCPSRTLCLDREALLAGTVFGRVDLDGEVMMGARATLVGASLSLVMSESGPRASITVPLGRWLRIERWVPLQAHLGVGLDGISIDPGFYAAAD